MIFAFLAVAGVGLAIFLGSMGSDDLDDAAQTYLDAHPDWQVESSEYLDQEGGTIRLVVWDHTRNVGRLALMESDVSADSGWSEQPLIAAMPDDPFAAEMFLDAFSDVFRSTSWTYATAVEQVDVVSDPQTWIVHYRVYEQGSEQWTEVRETWAIRYRDSGGWMVGDPGTVQPASETTPTP